MTGLMYITLHLIGDYLLQSDYIAANKSKNKIVLFLHVVLYTLVFTIAFKLTGKSVFKNSIIIFLSHFIIDSKRWGTSSSWHHKPVVIDQTLHLIVLVIIEKIK